MFTQKAVLYFTLAIAMLSIGLILGDLQIGILTLGLASLFFLANVVGLPEKVELALTREMIPDETFGDEDISVRSTVQNRTRSNLANLEILETLPKQILSSKGTNQIFATLRPHESTTLALEFPTPPRANYQIGPLIVRAKDPFGFYLVEKRHGPDTLSVMPRPERIRGVQLSPRRVRSWPGPVQSRFLGPGSEFYSMREYVSGDDPKRINWKASARHNNLIVNETEAERVTDVMVVLDTDVAISRPSEDELFEREIRATASVTRLLLRQGNRVGIVLQGGERGSLPAGFGKRQEKRILYLLAEAKPGRASVSTRHVMTLLANRMLPTRAQIIVISPLLDLEVREGITQLANAGYKTLVLSPMPGFPDFGSDVEKLAFRWAMLERSVTLLALEKSSTVVDWPRDLPLSTVLSRVRPQRVTVFA